MASAANVLPFVDPPGQKSLLAAIAKCIRDVKSKHDLDDITLAERLACSDETIKNAEAQKHLLNAVALARLEYWYGAEAVDPIRALTIRRYVTEPVSFEDRLDAIENHIAAIRRDMAA